MSSSSISKPIPVRQLALGMWCDLVSTAQAMRSWDWWTMPKWDAKRVLARLNTSYVPADRLPTVGEVMASTPARADRPESLYRLIDAAVTERWMDWDATMARRYPLQVVTRRGEVLEYGIWSHDGGFAQWGWDHAQQPS